ncbi:MAG: FkbM family methyltransferase [Planctomycetes bacterium]|nr:FkbM family methyltransferase [Planctomycetota bacterium]
MQMLVLFILMGVLLVVGVMWRRVETIRRRQRRRLRELESVQRALLCHIRADRQAQIERELRARGLTPALPIEFRASQGEDLFLWDLFRGQERGFFVEVGAYDGYHYSVSSIFEAVGWTGVLIEALPQRCRKCAERRPNSRVVHAALSRRGSAGTTKFMVSGADDLKQDTSFIVGGRFQPRAIRKKLGGASPIEVPVSYMDQVLGDVAAPVDFAVLDVEGDELDLLDGFDLDRYAVRVLLIEELTAGANPRLQREMASRGYELVVRMGRNDVYVCSREEALVRRAKQLVQLV